MPEAQLGALATCLHREGIPTTLHGQASIERGTCKIFTVVASEHQNGFSVVAEGEANQRMESLERYRDKKRRRLFSGAKTIRYEKRKVNADRRCASTAIVQMSDIWQGFRGLLTHCKFTEHADSPGTTRNAPWLQCCCMLLCSCAS